MNRIKTRKALNPEYRKHNPKRPEVNSFRSELKACLVAIKEAEEAKRIGEEFIKQPIQKFLQNTFYKDHLINTKDRIDLAIYTGKEVKSDVAVILELKQPSNKSEYLTETNLNKKALQELLWYYLNERIDGDNNNIKHLIATNGYTWFLFKSEDFYSFFYKNKALVKEYKNFKDGLKDSSKTDLFYKEIASKYIAEVEDKLPFVYLDFTKKALETYTDPDLNTLFKVFSDVNILGKPFGNDSNELKKEFYLELLHIIGLEEFKEKGKKLIYRKKKDERDYASLLENAIFTLEDKDYLRNVRRFDDDKAFNAGLSLCITWINRILFLKLLESQLLAYHRKAKEYKFLNSEFIAGFDDLNDLFFSVLAKKPEDRHPKFKDKHKYIPYLNSALFEKNDLETDTFAISALNDDKIDVFKGTILKESNGKRFKGKLETLDYLFKFLEAFDFAADGTEEITDEEDTKTLISASVLGKIFEKLNGYKEGSFYTPSHITMYMCKETLRKGVTQKFKENESEQIESYQDLISYCHNFFKHEDRKRLNDVFNSLKICDPAVGSGHFLVSALNELILIKHELGLLIDVKGKRLSDYDIDIVNDELYITDPNGFLIEYKPESDESVRIQHTLFQEKRTIIENILFGVDINPNSVKICRLRLWVELLKNAYYTNSGVLQTLPNIDINIKCGNTLISRFGLQDDLSKSFKGIDYNFNDYRQAVKRYKNSQTKEEKNSVLSIIKEVKNNFKSSFDSNAIADRQKIVGKYQSEKIKQDNLVSLYNEKITKGEKDKLKDLKEKAENALRKEKEILNNVIYKDAFEWRFEFPEVLNENGEYVGFDAVIGNPPYVGITEINSQEKKYFESSFQTGVGRFDLYSLFIERAMNINKESGSFSYIVPGKFLNNKQFVTAREIVCKNHGVTVVKIDGKVFEEAQVDSVIVENYPEENLKYKSFKITAEGLQKMSEVPMSNITSNAEVIFKLELNLANENLLTKIKKDTVKVIDIGEVKDGIIAGRIKDLLFSDKKNDNDSYKLFFGRHVNRYSLAETNTWVNYKPKEMMTEELKRVGNKGPGLRMRTKEIFEREKIMYRKVGKELIATLSDKDQFNEQTVHSCVISDDRVKLKYVLGLFNSQLFKFYYHKSNSEGGDIFPQIRISSVKSLPIKIADNSFQDQIEKLVDQILNIKSQDILKDTINLEEQIDELVYKIYGINKDEIKLIEKE
jgi:hypothetical protein